jgi:AcrR family transcriptional regulator
MRTGMDRYRLEFAGADVVLFEPTRDDADMFFTNVFSYRGRSRLCEHAYQRTRKDLYQRRHELQAIFARHGFQLNLGVLKDHTRSLLSRKRRPDLASSASALDSSLATWKRWLQAQKGRDPVAPALGNKASGIPCACQRCYPDPRRQSGSRWGTDGKETEAANPRENRRDQPALFNDFGEPNVTTTVIADEMNISPGNLYYHFHNKDEIIEEIFVVFEREIEETLAAPTRRLADVEDIWLFLHLLFEQIWKYRFFYRDLNDLLTRNRLLEIHFKQIMAHKVHTATNCARAGSDGCHARDNSGTAGSGDEHGGDRQLLAVVRVRLRSTRQGRGRSHRARCVSGDGDALAISA